MNEKVKKDILNLLKRGSFILDTAWDLAEEYDSSGGVIEQLDDAIEAIDNAKNLLNPEP